MAKLVSKTYGEALFELAVEEEKVDVFMEEITEIRKILAENTDFSRLMNHPKILKEEKLEVLENVFRGRIADELTGFLTLIVTKDRYHEIDAILDYFLAEIKSYKGIGITVCNLDNRTHIGYFQFGGISLNLILYDRTNFFRS